MNRKDELMQTVIHNIGLVDHHGNDKLTPDYIKKIRDAWELGLTSKNSICSYVGISTPTYDRFMETSPELSELRDLCQEKMKIDARKNIRRAIQNGHLDTSKWFLEKTDPQFQKKEPTVNVAVISVADREKEMSKFMERFTDAGVIETVGTEV